MSNTNTNNTNTQPRYEFVYNPPLTPAGDRDWRKELDVWKRGRNSGNAPLDITTIVVIDNLLDALDAARKERDDARSAGAWKYIGNPNDRIP